MREVGLRSPLHLAAVAVVAAFALLTVAAGAASAATDVSLVKDISPADDCSGCDLTDVDGTLFFTANDGVHGYELWKSDGTAEGTTLVKDIYPGAGGPRPGELTNVNGTLFFTADDGVHGYELWKSDGTTEGTTLVKDIFPGSAGIFGSGLRSVDGTLFFSAGDGIWKSDGTAEGTTLVKDISLVPLSFCGLASELTSVGGTLLFVVCDGFGRIELWRSNGTAEGTTRVKDIRPYSWIAIVNETLLFYACAPCGLWKSDGTDAGTAFVKDINTYRGGNYAYPNHPLSSVSGRAFFIANDGIHGWELWKSDGTPSGTRIVKDDPHNNPCPSIGDPPCNEPYAVGPWAWTNVGRTLFFGAAYDGHAGLWKSDGTEEGTTFVKDIIPFGPPSSMIDVEGTLFFDADDGVGGVDLWESDGTPAGTNLVKDYVGPGIGPWSLTNVQGTLFFIAGDGVHGTGLWKAERRVEPPQRDDYKNASRYCKALEAASQSPYKNHGKCVSQSK